MARKRHTAEQIILKLREAEVASACKATVTRTWNLPSATTMNFCSQVTGSARTCRDPKPVSDTTTQPDVEGPHLLGCGDPSVSYSIGTIGCGSATIEVSCTECD